MNDAVDDGWLPACPRADIADGDMLEVELPGGTPVLLLGVDGGVVAVCADCPHQATPLAEGTLEGTTLTCPLHEWDWDVTTGEPLDTAELPLPRYAVREDGGTIYVRMR